VQQIPDRPPCFFGFWPTGSIYQRVYLSTTANWFLKREANREAEAPKDVSDDIRDDRNSIYAVHVLP
jgi:hypothetical protein